MSVFIYGDNVNTDEIIPARYLAESDPAALAAHCMEDIDVDFSRLVRPGDVVVAGENFGCGSSREHAPIALRACGVSVVIAASFARIFFRNAINIGLPIMECPELVSAVSAGGAATAGDAVEADLVTGRVTCGGKVFQARPVPEFVRGIIAAGGLLESLEGRS